MGTRGYVMVRFRGRYYIRYHRFDSYYEGLGVEIIADIPTDPNEYQSLQIWSASSAILKL